MEGVGKGRERKVVMMKRSENTRSGSHMWIRKPTWTWGDIMILYPLYSFQSEFWFPITLAARISFFFFLIFSSLSLSNPRFSSLGLVMMFSQLWRFSLSFEFKPLFIFLILWILHLCSFKFYLHLNISNWVLIFIYFFHLVIEEFLLLFVLL